MRAEAVARVWPAMITGALWLPLSLKSSSLPHTLSRCRLVGPPVAVAAVADAIVGLERRGRHLPPFGVGGPLHVGGCLRRSLWRLCGGRRAGLPLAFHLGVRVVDGRVDAHAWLSLAGRPFLEPDVARLRTFAPLYTWSGPSPLGSPVVEVAKETAVRDALGVLQAAE